jgi:formate/nitrite transporter FocA (FNT family)
MAGPLTWFYAEEDEILSAIFAGNIAAADYFNWLATATLGNIFGGVFMVSLLNYGQVKLGGGGEIDTRLPKAG